MSHRPPLNHGRRALGHPMSTATVDPAKVIQDAGRQLIVELVDLLGRKDERDTEGLLDGISKLLGRARRAVNKAKKVAAAEEKPAAVEPAAPTATPVESERPPAQATVPASTPPPSRPVTVPIPETTLERPPAHTAPAATPGAPMSTTQLTAAVARHRSRARVVLWIAAVLAAVLLVILLSACGSSDPAPATPAVVMPADMEPLKCADFEPPPVPQPSEKFTARRCTDPDGSIRWISSFYQCTDGRIWPVLTENPGPPPAEPTGPEFDACVGR